MTERETKSSKRVSGQERFVVHAMNGPDGRSWGRLEAEPELHTSLPRVCRDHVSGPSPAFPGTLADR